jgi:hypothetical protein
MKLVASHSINVELADLKVDGSNIKNKAVSNNSGLGFILQKILNYYRDFRGL